MSNVLEYSHIMQKQETPFLMLYGHPIAENGVPVVLITDNKRYDEILEEYNPRFTIAGTDISVDLEVETDPYDENLTYIDVPSSRRNHDNISR